MDEASNENLAPHELEHFHSLFQRFRAQHQHPSSIPSATPRPQPLPATAAVPVPSTSSTPPPSSQVRQYGRQPAVTAYVPHTQSVLPSISAYQSARLSGGLGDPSNPSFSRGLGMGHPSLSQHRTPMTAIQPGSSFSQQPPPFLGFQGNTSQANQQRLASASSSLPRRPSMPIRTTSSTVRCTRGRAGRPPSLSTAPTINDVLVHNISNDSRLMRLRIKIYPPLGDYGIDYYVYRFHRDSFNEALRSNHLLFDMDLPTSSTIADVMQSVVGKMQESPFAYSFGDQDHNHNHHVLPHEALPLGLLQIVNRGRARASNNQIRLQAHPMMNNATLQAITTDPASAPLFIVSDISFEDGRLVLFFAVMGKTLKAHLLDAEGEHRRCHSCIPQSIWIRFPNDCHDNSEPDHPETSGGETETMDGNSDNDGEDDRIGGMSYETLSATIQPHSQLRLGLRSAGISLPSAPIITITPDATLPSELWSTPWTAPQTGVDVIDLSNLDASIFEIASVFRPLKLEISGDTVLDLAEKLVETIGEAVDQQDFERILSTEREFLMYVLESTHTSVEGHQNVRSVGRGIEREVVHLSYSCYARNAPQWFLPRAGGYSSIAVTHTMAPTSNRRLRNLSILGALTGLMLIYGMSPLPLSPVLIHFFLHDCNLHSIYPSFLAEWIPDLHKTLKDWLALDHTSDISAFQPHFSIYHDMQIACLEDRDAASHRALASEMLYRAIVGPEPHTHHEIQAFLQGFRMPCKRTGFNLSKIKTMIEGGSESFLNMIWTSHIKSFDDIAPHLRFSLPSRNVLSQLTVALSFHGDVTFEGLLYNFLKGSGIPCPTLFENARNHFTSIVDLSKIDDVDFRPRIFYWATTGSPSIEINGPGISIYLCGASDADYAIASQRDAMMDEGKICFKTCVSQIKVPVPYIEKLAGATYTFNVEPPSFQAAFDHWLLCEFLNAIGSHSIL